MKTLWAAFIVILFCSCGEPRATRSANWKEICRVANPSKTREFVYLQYNPFAGSSYEYTSRIVEFGHVFTDKDFAADHTIVAPSSPDVENTKWLDDSTVQAGIRTGPVYFSPVYYELADGKRSRTFRIQLHIRDWE